VIKTCIYYRTLKTIREDDRFKAINLSFPNCSSIKNQNLQTCDLAVIQGWMKPKSNSIHNIFRKEIIEHQIASKNHILTIDGNIFNYLNKGLYFRYSIDGIFANTGYYFNDEIDPTRWKSISKTLNYDLKPWRKTGDHIIILMQKSSGWTMDADNIEWCLKTINEIRKYSDRKILVRFHPSEKNAKEKFNNKINSQNVFLSTNTIIEDLRNAWCSITYNSSPGAVSVIEGIPVFITDPDYLKSPVASVGNTDLKLLENPYTPDRTNWIESISMSHFSIEQIEKGLLWDQVSNYFKKLGKV
jgi:hypothetical protein